jgi:GxxExxY protein
MNVPVIVEQRVGITYDELVIPNAYRLDLVVAGMVIVELKHVETLLTIHEAQLRTYLKLSELSCGILLNFNTVVMKNGIRRLDLPVLSRAVHPKRL